MAQFKPFKAVRPDCRYAEKVAALPYDVMNSEEAYEIAKDNPYSFLHVDKAEIDLPKGTDLYSVEVYNKAKENLAALEINGICRQDKSDCFYIYRQEMGGRTQTGLVGCASIDDYMNNVIKKHELTRADKEQDRINHVDYCDANTGPIFLTYRKNEKISSLISYWTGANEPVYDFTSDTNVKNTVWVIDSEDIVRQISDMFSGVENMYIADGHHRAASAVKVGNMRRKSNPQYTGKEEFNYFLAVAFCADELEIMDYNRLIKDLNGYSTEEFKKEISDKFEIELIGREAYKPGKAHEFGMLLDGEWHKITAKEGSFDRNDVIASLDVSILQNNLIGPVLGINDPRTDKRIDFVGGIRGLGELEKRTSEDMRLAFSMYATTVDELMEIADENKIMPPKSTWFEPKLLSGLFVHKLS